MLVRAGVAGRLDLALDAAVAEASRHDDAVHRRQPRLESAHAFSTSSESIQSICTSTPCAHPAWCSDSATERYASCSLDVLADQRDARPPAFLPDARHQCAPLVQLRRVACSRCSKLHHEIAQSTRFEHQRHLVDAARRSPRGSRRAALDVAEEGDLLAHLIADGDVGAAEDHVRLDADGAAAP